MRCSYWKYFLLFDLNSAHELVHPFFLHVILSTGGGGWKCVLYGVEKLDVIDRVPDSSVRGICPHSQ